MTTTVMEHSGGSYARCRIPGIVCTDRGTLLCCYECRYGESDWSAIDIGMRRSVDGGKSWSERTILRSSGGRYTLNNPIFLPDGERLHLLYHRNYSQCFHCVSLDDGLSWSDPRDITCAQEGLLDRYCWTVIAAGPGHGIRLRSGRLLAPVWMAGDSSNIFSHRPSVVATLYSDDRGESWQCGQIIPGGPSLVNPNESCLAELSGGGVKIFMRHETDDRLRRTAVSPDGISGWSEPVQEPALPDPVCAAGLVGYGEQLWFSNCASRTARKNLTLRESPDGGVTWPRRLLVSRDAGYSDLCYSPRQNRIFVFYEADAAGEEGRRDFQLAVASVDPSELEQAGSPDTLEPEATGREETRHD